MKTVGIFLFGSGLLIQGKELLQAEVILHDIGGSLYAYIAEVPGFIDNFGNILLVVGVADDDRWQYPPESCPSSPDSSR